MPKLERLRQLRRFIRPTSWWRLAVIATDPRWAPVFDSFDRSTPEARFRDPTPWFARHAMPVLIEEVKRRRGQAVLEWGTGGSTLWYCQMGLRVTGIEHDSEWYALCRAHIGEEADLRLVPGQREYASPDVDCSAYSVFVIDGQSRTECAFFLAEQIAAGRIAGGSLVVLDDSQRPAYHGGFESLAAACSRHRSYSGPVGIELDQMTTLFWV